MNKKWNCENGLFDGFNKNFAGALGNLFCIAFRSGKTEVESLLNFVRLEALANTRKSWASVEAIEVYTKFSESLETPKAREFAEHIIWRESLSDDEKRKLKNESKQDGLNSWMSAQSPSEKQLNYLKSLGCQTIPTSKLEASNLIEEFLKKK